MKKKALNALKRNMSLDDAKDLLKLLFLENERKALHLLLLKMNVKGCSDPDTIDDICEGIRQKITYNAQILGVKEDQKYIDEKIKCIKGKVNYFQDYDPMQKWKQEFEHVPVQSHCVYCQKEIFDSDICTICRVNLEYYEMKNGKKA